LPSRLDIAGDSLNFGRARSGWHWIVPRSSRCSCKSSRQTRVPASR